MLYKNTSYTEKTFYGVTFKPGEIKEVTGQINNRWMITVDSQKKETKVQQKPSPEKPKKEAPKSEEAPKQEQKQEQKKDETEQK